MNTYANITHISLFSDELRKTFGCRPPTVTQFLGSYAHLKKGNNDDLREYILDNIGGLTKLTQVTENLLKKIKDAGLISQENVDLVVKKSLNLLVFKYEIL